MSDGAIAAIWIVVTVLVVGYFVLRTMGRKGKLGSGITFKVDARIAVKRPAEFVFDKLAGPSGLSWIETPWEIQKAKAIQDGSVLTWTLGEVRTITTPVKLDRPRAISWSNLGLEGNISIGSRGDETVVSFTGSFPAGWTTIKDMAFFLVMGGKMSRMAREACESQLESFLVRHQSHGEAGVVAPRPVSRQPVIPQPVVAVAPVAPQPVVAATPLAPVAAVGHFCGQCGAQFSSTEARFCRTCGSPRG